MNLQRLKSEPKLNYFIIVDLIDEHNIDVEDAKHKFLD